MAIIQRTIDINATKNDTWALLSDLARVTDWLAMAQSANVEGQAKGAVRTCNLGEHGHLEERFTDWKEGSAVKFAVSGDFPLKNGVAEWTLVPRGDKVTLEYRLDHGGPLDAAPADAVQQVEGMVDFVTSSFKHYAETGKVLMPNA